jgi:hypothetical protein
MFCILLCKCSFFLSLLFLSPKTRTQLLHNFMNLHFVLIPVPGVSPLLLGISTIGSLMRAESWIPHQGNAYCKITIRRKSLMVVGPRAQNEERHCISASVDKKGKDGELFMKYNVPWKLHYRKSTRCIVAAMFHNACLYMLL